MMSFRSAVVCLGVCCGLVVFGLQLVLAGFNQDVRPAEPARLFYVQPTATGSVRVELLGRRETLPIPAKAVFGPNLRVELRSVRREGLRWLRLRTFKAVDWLEEFYARDLRGKFPARILQLIVSSVAAFHYSMI